MRPFVEYDHIAQLLLSNPYKESERRRQLDEDMRQREEMTKLKLKKEWENLENEKRRLSLKNRFYRRSGASDTSSEESSQFLG